jgi:hypothetical protein
MMRTKIKINSVTITKYGETIKLEEQVIYD